MTQIRKILVISGRDTQSLVDTIKDFGYDVDTAEDKFQVESMISLDFDLVLLDSEISSESEFEIVQQIREDQEFNNVPICVMVSVDDKKENWSRLASLGVNEFITKPLDLLKLKMRISSLVKVKIAQDQKKRYLEDLERSVEERTAHLKKSLKETAEARRQVHQSRLETIERLARAAEYKDEDTGCHIKRVSHYSFLIAVQAGCSPRECELIRDASPMHDVGKMGIPDSILLKPGSLDPSEWEIMKSHTLLGQKILENSSSEVLQAGSIIAASHHEKWDGKGYPGGILASEIPLSGRIVAIADVFDALTTKRPYKEAFSNEKAIEIMKADRGTHFDPELLDIFLSVFSDVEKIQTECSSKD